MTKQLQGTHVIVEEPVDDDVYHAVPDVVAGVVHPRREVDGVARDQQRLALGERGVGRYRQVADQVVCEFNYIRVSRKFLIKKSKAFLRPL